MKTSPGLLPCLVLCACLLGSGHVNAEYFINRFGRTLLQKEGVAASYLIPAKTPTLCTGSQCCQEDDYTSAYQIMNLNSTASMQGGRSYTTFFMNIQRSFTCDTTIDKAQCCNSDIRRIWIDVDPELKVHFATLNGVSSANSVVQDAYGFRLDLTPQQYASLTPTTILSITVAGDVKSLCPVPDLAPVEGLCDIILEGGTSDNPAACCPRGVTRPSSIQNWQAPSNFFTCVSDQGAAPFSLTQAHISNVYYDDDVADKYVDYSLVLGQNSGCREGPNSCCGMHLDDLEIKITADALVTAVTIDGTGFPFTTSTWHEDDASTGFKVLSVAGLHWPVEDIPQGGKKVVVTVKVPVSANVVPHLCGPADTNQLEAYASCAYFMYSDDGFCCPSGQTNAVPGPIMPFICSPTQEVPLADTSLLFTYYENFVGPRHNDFVFMVNSKAGAECTSAHCVEPCAWSLAVNDDIIPSLTFASDASNVAAATLLNRGPDASVIFSYPVGTPSGFFTVRTPTRTPLEKLCRAGAHPDQGNWPCAATIRAGSVYAVAFFNQDSLAIKTYPDICPVGDLLEQSCVRPTGVRFNAPDDKGDTSLEFTLTSYDPSTGCTPAPGLSFEVMMQKAHVEALQASNTLEPSHATFTPTSGITWSSTPTGSGGQQTYRLKLSGSMDINSVCTQGLPDQPPNSCMVQISNGETCFNGYVTPTRDPAFTWWPGIGSAQRGAKASVVAPAVVIPVVVLVALLALFLYARKRRSRYEYGDSEYESDGEGDLHSPLTGGQPHADEVEPSMASARSMRSARSGRSGAGQSAAGSDIQVRLQGAAR